MPIVIKVENREAFLVLLELLLDEPVQLEQGQLEDLDGLDDLGSQLELELQFLL